MPKFALEKLTVVNGTQQEFDKLLIDGECMLDIFEKSLQVQDLKHLRKIYTNMDRVVNGKSLPFDKFKEISGAKDIVKEYEFKSGPIRVYAFQKHGGKIVVSGGTKKTQDSDIARLGRIKDAYYESLKPKK